MDYLLSDSEREALYERGVEVAEISIGDALFHRHGILFHEEDGEAVMEILGLLGSPGGYEGLRNPKGEYIEECCLWKLSDLPTPENPVVWGFGGNGRDFKPLRADQFRLSRGLVVNSGDNDVAEYRHRPGILFVNFFMSPCQDRQETESGEVRWYRLVPNGLGPEYQLINDSRGEPLACFRGDEEGGSLWLLFEPYHQHDDVLLEYVVECASRLMHPDLGAPRSIAEHRLYIDRDRYIQRAVRMLEDEKRHIDGRIEDVEEMARNARAEHIRAIRSVEAARQRREELRTGNEEALVQEFRDRLLAEFEALMASPDFEAVRVHEGEVSVVTRPIEITYNGKIYEMGRYEIHVSSTSLYIELVDGGSHRPVHPHVDNGGAICFGNVDEAVAKLQASMQFGLLFQLVVRFLEESYDPADSYSKLSDYNVPTRDIAEEVGAVASASETGGRRVGRRRQHSS
ncbi:MAG TPA: hypothetical protein VMT23_02470 [Candidatus Binatia bacterium]|nr:hypothetical protein [Candidatus Binatia bacterium]